mgnify:FL=1
MINDPEDWQQQLLHQPLVLTGGWLAAIGLFVIGWSRIHAGAPWTAWLAPVALAAVLYCVTCRLILSAANRGR